MKLNKTMLIVALIAMVLVALTTVVNAAAMMIYILIWKEYQ